MSSESNHNPRNSNPNRQSGTSGVYNANPQRSKFFRDLPYSFNNSDLRQLCESEGLEVEDAHVVLNGGRKTLQYGYVLFRSEADAKRAQEILHNRRVLGRDIRVCEFNRESNGESSKDGKVMVSFKCSHQSIPLITEQTVRDIFERKFNHALTSVSIRKHQSKPNQGGQSGYGFISFGDEALDNEAVSTIKKVEIDGIFFDCTRSTADRSPDTQASAAPLPATRGSSPRASEGSSPSDGPSPYAKESSSSSPSGEVGKSPRANIIQTGSGTTRSSLAAGVSVHDVHNLRPSRRPNGTSIRNRTFGVSDKLREEETTTNNSQGGKNRQKNLSAEEESFPSFQVMPLQSSGTSSQLHQQQQQQQMNQSLQYVTSWPIHQSPPTPITTYNVPMSMSQPLAVGIPNSSTTLGQAYPSPTILYAVTSPNMGYTTTYMGSPAGYSLTPATQSTQQPLPMPIQPPAPQSYSPRYAHHNPHAHHHIHHQQPQHIYVTVPTQSSTENVPVATTNNSNNNTNNSKLEYMASEAQLRYSQQMTGSQQQPQQQQMQTRHRTFSADDNSPTPIGSYYLSPSDSTYHDRASFSDMYSNTNGGSVVGGASQPSQGQSTGVSSANPASFHPTPPISYAPQPVQQQPSYHPQLMSSQQVLHPHHHHMNPTQQHVHHHQYPLNNVPVQATTFTNPMGTYSFHPN